MTKRHSGPREKLAWQRRKNVEKKSAQKSGVSSFSKRQMQWVGAHGYVYDAGFPKGSRIVPKRGMLG